MIDLLLTLPDRGSDGFIVFKANGNKFSALHLALHLITENPDETEVTRLIISILLQKYHDKKYLDSTEGPHHTTALAMAIEVGNHRVVQSLLEAGADPNIQDGYGRTPLDKLYWRNCYPALTEAMKKVDINDNLRVGRTLNLVSSNASEVLSLLTSFGPKPNAFQFPAWFEKDPGYRSLDWVIERLKETRNPERQRNVESTTPNWGGFPINLPERPMQFSKADRSAKQ